MSETVRADLAVIGGGAVELATAFHAVRRGYQAVVLGRHDFPYPEHPRVAMSMPFELQCDDVSAATLVLESLPHWAELQELTGERLIERVGSVCFGDTRTTAVRHRFSALTEVMSGLGVPYEELTSLDLAKRFGLDGGAKKWTGFYQQDSGAINLWAAMRVLLRNVEDTARVMHNQRVVALESTSDGVRVSTADGTTVLASRLLVSAEPRNDDVLRMLGVDLRSGSSESVTAHFHTHVPMAGTAIWTGVRHDDVEGLVIARGYPELRWDKPGHAEVGVDRVMTSHRVDSSELLVMASEWVGNHMPDLDRAPAASSMSSTVRPLFTPPGRPRPLAGDVLVDFAPTVVPHSRNVVICSSGGMFSLVPLLGSICADLAFHGHTEHDVAFGALHPEIWSPVGGPA